MKQPCIIVVGHISTKLQSDIAQLCLTHIKEYAPPYPRLFISSCAPSLPSFISQELIHLVDHLFLTTYNPLIDKEDGIDRINTFYSCNLWKVERTIEVPKAYYGYSQLLKIATALEYALQMGYNDFLVVNYDAFLMDSVFFENIFKSVSSVFIQTAAGSISTDVMRLNITGAEVFKKLSQLEVYKQYQKKCQTSLLEKIVSAALDDEKCHKIVWSQSTSVYRIPPYNVTLNNSSTWNFPYAVNSDGTLYVVVDPGQGLPVHTTDSKLEIGYNGKFTEFDISKGQAYLHPVCLYSGGDVEIVVRSNFGELTIPLKEKDINNTTLTGF